MTNGYLNLSDKAVGILINLYAIGEAFMEVNDSDIVLEMYRISKTNKPVVGSCQSDSVSAVFYFNKVVFIMPNGQDTMILQTRFETGGESGLHTFQIEYNLGDNIVLFRVYRTVV